MLESILIRSNSIKAASFIIHHHYQLVNIQLRKKRLSTATVTVMANNCMVCDLSIAPDQESWLLGWSSDGSVVQQHRTCETPSSEEQIASGNYKVSEFSNFCCEIILG